MMDHQNIARVLDAGTTESGRPFFVMELVHGVSITEYSEPESAHNERAPRAIHFRLSGDSARPPKRDHPP